MFNSLLAVLFVPAALVQAWTSTSVSIVKASSCETRLGSGKTQPTPLPYSTVSKHVTSSSLVPAITNTGIFRITTGPVVTVTHYTSTEITWADETVTLPAYTTGVVIASVITTATIPKTVCTNGVNPSTVTVYSGTYVPSPGQNTVPPATYPTAIVCTEATTTYQAFIPIESTVITATVGSTTTVIRPTTTITTTVIFGTHTEYASTTTITSTSYTVTNTLSTTRVSCAPTTTLTLAAKCAPTNLIGAIGDHGLYADLNIYAANTVVTYGPRPDQPYQLDPSLCCQMCLDSPGCGASMSGGSSPFCGLFYIPSNGTSGGRCGTDIFTFDAHYDALPGAGLIVQSGCDSVKFKTT